MTTDNLYQNLFNLTQQSEAFYFVDYGKYRVFNYRLASYTDFLAPDALEARGIMFYLNEDGPRLVCRPFKKFFNKDETPFTANLDFSKVQKAAIKEDGSIITTYIDQETTTLKVKSKTSLNSEQANMASRFLDQPENSKLKFEVGRLTALGFTVMFELVSPANRIVLEYPKTELRVIGVRHMESGVLYHRDDLWCYPQISMNWVKEIDNIDPESIANMQGIEGYVFYWPSGLMAKVKTEWYKTLPHLKDSVDTPKRLFNAIIDECVDDVKAMFATDAFTLKRIQDMEDVVKPRFNHMVKTVEDFYQANKHLSRKDYAIKGQQELTKFFNLGMTLYLGKEPLYKDFAKKYREEHFGITGDDATINE